LKQPTQSYTESFRNQDCVVESLSLVGAKAREREDLGSKTMRQSCGLWTL